MGKLMSAIKFIEIATHKVMESFATVNLKGHSTAYVYSSPAFIAIAAIKITLDLRSLRNFAEKQEGNSEENHHARCKKQI